MLISHVAEAVFEFIRAKTLSEKKEIAQARREELFTHLADQIFDELLRNYRDNPAPLMMLQEHRALLDRCRKEELVIVFATTSGPTSRPEISLEFLEQVKGIHSECELPNLLAEHPNLFTILYPMTPEGSSVSGLVSGDQTFFPGPIIALPPKDFHLHHLMFEAISLPKRYFTTRIEGGPEAAGQCPLLLMGKEYRCIFGIKTEVDSMFGLSAEIPPEALAKMLERNPQVLAVGQGLEIRDSFVTLNIDRQNYTSTEAAITFRAIKPGACTLRLLLMLDGNVVREIEYYFSAVLSLGTIPEGPLDEKGCEWPTPEECHRLRKQKLHIGVSAVTSEMLMLNFIWSNQNMVTLPLKGTVRTDLEQKKTAFLSRFAHSMGHIRSEDLTRSARDEFLQGLNDLGNEIFRTLFIIPAKPDLLQTGQEMRELLGTSDPASIQISPGQEHLPWMFLSDGKGPLGLRHEVEYILPGTSGLTCPLDLTLKPLSVVCALAPAFEPIRLGDGQSVIEIQKTTLARLAKDRFDVRLVQDEQQFLAELGNPADVIYAYCHGAGGSGGPRLWMTQQAAAIYGDTIDMNPAIKWTHHPLVILAACTGGAIDPFRATGLANSFMAMGARGYIAVDGEVPTTFASLFMSDFFEEFFIKGGVPVGEVLFNLRRKFLEKNNNPWGILFTQFCRSEITVANN
jgi:hypothetical protein